MGTTGVVTSKVLAGESNTITVQPYRFRTAYWPDEVRDVDAPPIVFSVA